MTTPETKTPTATTGGREVPLVRATAVTVVVALVVNVVLAATGVAVLDIGDAYDPLGMTSVALTTVLAITASGVLLAVLQRRTSRPQTLFRVLVTVGALASLGGPLSLLSSDQYPQATGPVVTWTAMLHLTTAAAVLAILATRGGDRR